MFERIIYLANYLGYSGIPELAVALQYNSPEKLYRLKKEGTKPSIDIVIDISNLFENLNLKWFLTGIGDPFFNELKTTPNSTPNSTPNPTISEKAAPVVEYIPVPVNSSGNENIIFVELKSAAGFGAVINNEKALNEYPTIALPGFLYRGRKQYVAFEIDGDSMHPTIQHRDIIIGSRIEGLHDIRNGYVYTLVFNDMIITKRLHYTKGDDYIECLSDNDDVYEPYKQDISEITGIYKGEGIVRTQFRNWNNDVRKNIANLSKRLTTIERYLKKD